jgi:hypothetical protein
MGLLDALRDTQFRRDLGTNARQLGQSMSNTAASTVTAPADALAWLLRKAKVPVPQNPIGGSDWAMRQGFMADVPDGAPKLAGETLGLLAPMAGTQQGAAAVARGLRQMGANAAAPAMLNKQAGMINTQFGRIPENGADTRKLADMLEKAGMKSGYSVVRSGSAISPSQYVTFSKPVGDAEKTLQVRLSNHADKYPELSTGVRTSVDPSTEVTFEQATNWLKKEGFPTALSKKFEHIPSYEDYHAAQRALRETPEYRLEQLQGAWLNKPKATRGGYPTLESVMESMKK